MDKLAVKFERMERLIAQLQLENSNLTEENKNLKEKYHILELKSGGKIEQLRKENESERTKYQIIINNLTTEIDRLVVRNTELEGEEIKLNPSVIARKKKRVRIFNPL